MDVRRWWGSAAVVSVIGLVGACVGGSPGDEGETEGAGAWGAGPGESIVTELHEQFGERAVETLRPSTVVVERQGERFVPQLEVPSRPKQPRATVSLPERADGWVELREQLSDVHIRFQLVGAGSAPGILQDGLVSYRDGWQPGSGARGHLVLRPVHNGVEDFVSLPAAPPDGRVSYRVELGAQVAGLRLVDDVLEFVDAENTPRLRMTRPHLIDADGRWLDGETEVADCNVDRDPADPAWRAVVAPGATTCIVEVIVGDDAAYPVLLDPAWTTTDTMGTARAHHTASSVMANGAERILVAGGLTTGTVYTGAAELFNPTTETWATTDDISTSEKAYHTATILDAASRYVMVVGGRFTDAGSNSNVSNNVRRYDANAGTWTTRGGLNLARTNHTATLLADGQVLVAGGTTTVSTGSTTSSVELYNPATNAWTTVASLNTARSDHVAGLTPEGVIVAGGQASPAADPLTTEEYYQANDSWDDTIGNIQAARRGAILLPYGNSNPPESYLMIGGNGTDSSSADRYSWGFIPPWTRFDGGASISAGVSGATSRSMNPPWTRPVAMDNSNATVYRSNAPGVLFDASPPSPMDHDYGAAAALGDGRVLFTGGDSPSPATTRSTLFEFQPTGEVCQEHGQCVSWNCVDGVCCNTTCTGLCQACSAALKGQGADGTCGDIAAGMPASPASDCVDEGANTCGLNGMCAGNGLCQEYLSGTSCGTTSCAGSTLTLPECNGSGLCQDATASCSPYQCDVGGTCRTSCVTVGDCLPGFFCNGGACEGVNPDGTACSEDTECTSANCIDGFCCNSACGKQCEACNVAGSVGTCTEVVGNPVLGGGRSPCTAQGSTCGGSCDGINRDACAFPLNGVACGPANCNDGDITGDLCNGTGACTPGSLGNCFPYSNCADANNCDTSCAGDVQCVDNYYCHLALSICAEDFDNGGACTRAEQCKSGKCVDGVCCSTDCDGQCQSCAVAGSEGTCTAVDGDAPATKTPCTGAGTACGGTCDSANPTACTYPAAGTPCGATCTDNAEVVSTCNDAGECNPGAPADCGDFQCVDGTGCITNCNTDSDCAAGAVCETTSGQCVPENAGTCADEFTAESPDGTQTPCSPYRCVNGACRDSCASATDCAADHDCTGGTCVPTAGSGGAGDDSDADPDGGEGGCSCSVPGGEAPRVPWAWLLVGVGALLTRRRATR